MGIIADLSKWQGDVDFAKLAKVVDGVILRVSSGLSADSKYKDYVAACKKYDIPFGGYHYFSASDTVSAVAQAKFCLSLLDKASHFLAVDIETQNCSSVSALVSASQAFIDLLKKAGIKKVGKYSYSSFYSAHDLDKVNADWLWIANYGVDNGKPDSSARPSLPEQLWQYTQHGHLDGVNGNVDLDMVSGDKSVSWFFGTDSVPVVKPKPATAPVVKPPVKAPVKTPVVKPLFHKVVNGDTVSELSAKFGSSLAQIRAWNGLDKEYTIYIGENIRVK